MDLVRGLRFLIMSGKQTTTTTKSIKEAQDLKSSLYKELIVKSVYETTGPTCSHNDGQQDLPLIHTMMDNHSVLELYTDFLIKHNIKCTHRTMQRYKLISRHLPNTRPGVPETTCCP